MKRIITETILLLSFAAAALASPAYPGKITLKDASGRTRDVYMHGDEFCHWATDASSGREVSILRGGIVKDLPATRAPRRYSPSWRRVYTPTAGPITKGNNHFLVILVAFADKAFSVSSPQDRFTRLLNQDGYSDFGGTGSVKQYYRDQSSGVFDPIFDVVGPVTLSGNIADYGGNDEEGDDKNSTGAFAEAVRIAHEKGLADFSKYDADGDGYVDNIFFYYAGYNEAEGGGDDCIWPHAYGFYGANSVSYDGKRLGRYACTSELKGSSGANMCGIGTFCHEFGHVLGLPDFYDTDYAENGTASTVYSFSLMCAGNYNNGGCTPPNLGAIERNMLGWMDFPQEWTEAGHKTIKAITENEAFRLSSTNPDEFFLLEVRDASGWDRYIDGKPQGLLIYHVDQSSADLDGLTPIRRWESGYSINTIGSHPCYYVVPASYENKYGSYVFPGTSSKTAFGMNTSPSNKDYIGGNAGFNLTDISYDGGTVSLNLEIVNTLTITGVVTDSDGNPLEGVSVSATDSSPSPAPRKSLGRIFSQRDAQMAAAVGTCITDASGKYSIEIPAGAQYPVEVAFSKPYYNPSSFTVSKLSGRITKNLFLRNIAENAKESLQKCGPVSGYGIGTGTSPTTITAGVYYAPEEIADKVGMRITDISFLFYANKVDEVSVFIDLGEQRALARVVQGPLLGKMNTIDVSDADIRIPEGEPLIFGYSVKNADDGNGYPLAIDGLKDEEAAEGGCIIGDGYMCPADSEDWGTAAFNLIVKASLQSVNSPFPALGIKIIANPGNYVAGDSFALRFSESNGETPVSTVWYFDSEVQSESSVTLTSGRHEVKAVCTYADGSTEEIVQVIEVK